MPTTSPFAATLDWARTLVAGLTPNTDAAKTFRSVAGDLAIDEEPSVSHRSFSIIADTQPGFTGDIFTTGTRQAKRRFRLAIAYDSLQDSKHNEQAMAEDDDRIIFAIERGPYVERRRSDDQLRRRHAHLARRLHPPNPHFRSALHAPALKRRRGHPMGNAKLKQLFIKKENTFNTNPFAGDLSDADSATMVRAEDIQFNIDQEFLERMVQLARHGRILGTTGAKKGTITFKMDLSLHGTLDVALQCASLKKYTAANTAVANDTPAAADEIKLTDATGFLDGNTFGVPIAGLVTAGELQARFIQGNAPSYDVAPAFSRNPIAAEVVYGGSTYAMYPHDDGDTATFIGEGNGYRIIATGCRAAPPKITGKVGQRVMLEFTFQITTFVFSANNATYSQLTGAAAAKMLSSAFFWKDGGGGEHAGRRRGAGLRRQAGRQGELQRSGREDRLDTQRLQSQAEGLAVLQHPVADGLHRRHRRPGRARSARPRARRGRLHPDPRGAGHEVPGAQGDQQFVHRPRHRAHSHRRRDAHRDPGGRPLPHLQLTGCAHDLSHGK
jgi:hypothetical protein